MSITPGELLLVRSTEFKKGHGKVQDETAKRKCSCSEVVPGDLSRCLHHLGFQLSAVLQMVRIDVVDSTVRWIRLTVADTALFDTIKRGLQAMALVTSHDLRTF